ncbi:MAG: hypothetical protein HY073_03770 [Deltaproteobacteria bacterium]|nr:hypothetical protein [Deltaproteobacteria bacterium]
MEIYAREDENKARQFSGTLIALSEAHEMDWFEREDALYRMVEPDFINNSDRNHLFFLYAHLLPFVEENSRQRLIRVLKRGILSEDEMAIFERARIIHDPNPLVATWKSNYKVRNWL